MQKGFTLVEVLAVGLVLAVLAMVAVPSFRQTIANRELNDAARQLAGDLRYLQQLSLNAPAGTLYTISFRNASPYGYYVVSNAAASSKALQTVSFPTSVALTAPPGTVHFNSRGVPDSGYQITLKSNVIKKFKYVYVEGAVGRVRISD